MYNSINEVDAIKFHNSEKNKNRKCGEIEENCLTYSVYAAIFVDEI